LNCPIYQIDVWHAFPSAASDQTTKSRLLGYGGL
jgi:hypothetical protein